MTKIFTALFAAALVFSPVPDTYIPADDDVTALAQMAYGEARGLADYEIAACMWVALNRLDHGGYGDTVEAVVSAPGQFAGYSAENPVDEELAAIARDVLTRHDAQQRGGVLFRICGVCHVHPPSCPAPVIIRPSCSLVVPLASTTPVTCP